MIEASLPLSFSSNQKEVSSGSHDDDPMKSRRGGQSSPESQNTHKEMDSGPMDDGTVTNR